VTGPIDGSPRAARIQILLTAVLFSTGGATIKATALGGWQVAGLRSGIAALALVALLPEARRGWSGRSLAVGVVHGATMILFVQANKLTTAANAIFLQSTAPLFTLLLGPWLLKEPVRRRDLAFLAARAGGGARVMAGVDPPTRTAPRPRLGNLLGAACGPFWALTLVGLRWIGVGGGSPATVVVAGNALVFAATLPLALPVRGAGPADWAVLGYLGVFQIGLAYVLLTRAIRRLPALEAALLLLIEPVLNPVWAWLAHGEIPAGWSLAGCAVILAATAVQTWTAGRRLPAG
jgi:drug/metabolite transporter (DMT)-like permease